MIKAKQKESKREKVPSGTHIARCYEMIHIGTVTWEYLGEVKETDKVRITFELPGEMRQFNEEQMQPMVISKEYTLSMHEKANLRRDLESWRGKSFTDAEARDFDILKLIGKPCSLGVIHRENKNGNVYANISSISGLPKGIDAPAQINPNSILDYNENWSAEKFESLPDWITDQMKLTPEYEQVSQEESTEITEEQFELVTKLGYDNDEAPF